MDALPDPELINSLSPEQFQRFLEGPAGVPPPGELSDLDAHGIDNWFVLFLVLRVLASICFLVRIFSKAFILRKFVKSDYAMTVAWAFLMAFFVPLWMTGEIAPDVAQWNLRPQRPFPDVWHHVAIILYGVTLFFIKLSLLFQLEEIFGQERDWLWWPCHALIGFNFVYDHYVPLDISMQTAFRLLEHDGSDQSPVFRCYPSSRKPRRCQLHHRRTTFRHANDAHLATTDASPKENRVLSSVLNWSGVRSSVRHNRLSLTISKSHSACVCGVMRLYYAVMMFRDWLNLSHYMYITRFWMIPETPGWIVAGCLPSVPRFARTIARSDFVPRWRNSLWKALTPAPSRATGNGDGNPAADRPEPSPIRSKNWWSRVGSIPLTTFASLPGTTVATRNIHSANSAATTHELR
ncbi:hypothetical protein BDV19DRAFT_395121 [Aspergillus venezuelensis]